MNPGTIIHLLAEGDAGSYAKCASLVLIKHWQKDEYPDKACWES
jgi:hypothetical protein